MNQFLLFRRSLALSLALLLAACASSGDSPTGTPSEVQEIQSQLLGDMPLPAASKIIGSDSLIIGRGDNWVGRVVLSGVQTPTDIYAFFQAEYPKSLPTQGRNTKPRIHRERSNLRISRKKNKGNWHSCSAPHPVFPSASSFSLYLSSRLNIARPATAPRMMFR